MSSPNATLTEMRARTGFCEVCGQPATVFWQDAVDVSSGLASATHQAIIRHAACAEHAPLRWQADTTLRGVPPVGLALEGTPNGLR